MPKKEEKKEYLYKRQSCYDIWDDKQIKDMEKFTKEYMSFLDGSKTERLFAANAIGLLKKSGFEDINNVSKKLGDKIYMGYREKNVFAVRMGKKPLSEGFRLICAHMDSPRIDIKYMPFYDSDGLCLMKTHYYGGIKKYQWTTLSLSMIGTIFDKNGKKIYINIGEKDDEPVFFLSDLLPHLARDQMSKDGNKVIEAEDMNLIIGSKYSPEKKEVLKENILKILFEKYGLTEHSFAGAEIELVPSQKSREIGFDRSMVGGYGHDDKICSYIGLRALLDQKEIPEYTSIIYLTDKEEIGSEGSTSAQARTFRYFVEKIYSLSNKTFSPMEIDEIMMKSKAISGDVSVVLDPNFKGVFDPMNTALINYGVIIEKYVGARGKAGTNDADAEYVQQLKMHFEKSKIPYQFGGLGKVDLGGGGTISMYFANMMIEIIDMGVGVINMHSPFEVVSKADLYAAYQAYKSFWNLK